MSASARKEAEEKWSSKLASLTLEGEAQVSGFVDCCSYPII